MLPEVCCAAACRLTRAPEAQRANTYAKTKRQDFTAAKYFTGGSLTHQSGRARAASSLPAHLLQQPVHLHVHEPSITSPSRADTIKEKLLSNVDGRLKLPRVVASPDRAAGRAREWGCSGPAAVTSRLADAFHQHSAPKESYWPSLIHHTHRTSLTGRDLEEEVAPAVTLMSGTVLLF